MLIKLFGRTNLFNQQLRKCQIKCAINQLNLEEDETRLNKNDSNKNDLNDKNEQNNLNSQIYNENEIEKHNQNDNSINLKRPKKKSVIYFDRSKPKTDPNIKSIVRVNRYKKAMGLPDDLSFDESAKIINEFFNQISPGNTKCETHPFIRSLIWH